MKGGNDLRGTVMLESGLVDVAVCLVEGNEAIVHDAEGVSYWVDVRDVEFETE